eukprot:Opistho-1_new@26921
MAEALPANLKHLLNGLAEAVEVVVDEAVLLKVLLSQETHQRKIPVDLAEVENHAVVELDDGRRRAIVRNAFHVILHAVNAGHVNDNVNHVARELVRLHVNGRAVCRNVDLADDVEEKRLLNARVRNEDVEEVFERRQLRNELLDDLAEGLENRVVVDAREVKAEVDVAKAGVCELIECALVDVPLCLNLVVVGEAVHLVDEHLECDVLVHLVGLGDRHKELRKRLHVVILGVNHEHERTAAAEDVVRVERRVEKVDLSGEVPHLKLHKRAVRNVALHDFARALKEQRLVRRHLVKNDLLNRRLAAPPKPHEKNARPHVLCVDT